MINYVRKTQIADSLDIGTSTLERWIDEGRLVLPAPFKPTQRTTLYPEKEVAEAVANMVGATMKKAADEAPFKAVNV